MQAWGYCQSFWKFCIIGERLNWKIDSYYSSLGYAFPPILFITELFWHKQADSLHSGSISFGRFENEPLSWERRSSFSHNRYLEEVEKCSKPGSVIEKKAYFEAHFRKKGLLSPNSSDCHNDGEYQTGEKDVLESREQFEHVNEGSHYALFDESPNGSEYHGEYNVTGCEMKNPGFSFSVPQMESALNNADVLVDYVNAEETRQVEIDCDKFLSVNDGPEITIDHSPSGDAVKADKSSKSIANFEPEIEENQNFDCDTVNAEKSPKGTDPSPKTGPAVKVDITSLEHSPNPSPKVWIFKNIIKIAILSSLSIVPCLSKAIIWWSIPNHYLK